MLIISLFKMKRIYQQLRPRCDSINSDLDCQEDKKKEEVKKPVVIKSAMDLLRDHSRAIQR